MLEATLDQCKDQLATYFGDSYAETLPPVVLRYLLTVWLPQNPVRTIGEERYKGDFKGNNGQPKGKNSQGKSEKGLTLGATARRYRGKRSGKTAINEGPSHMQVAVACPKRASESRKVYRVRTLSTLRSARKERR